MAQSSRRVAVLMGGPSEEHDISLATGTQVLEALAEERPLPVVVERDGVWTVDGVRTSGVGDALQRIERSAGVVFIALHGPFGEDGTVQGLLEAAHVPYTGSGVAASALAMDKARAKLVYQSYGLATPTFSALLRGEDWDVDEVIDRCRLPCVVKPNANGSSVGISFPEDRAQLVAAVEAHRAAGLEVLIEERILGREFTCGVLENAREGRTFPLPVTEIIPGEAYAFFDYEAKYKPGATREITPADIPDELVACMQSAALDAHRALGCRDYSRSDFLLDETRGPLILETNTIPGLTKQSLLPQAAAVHGIDFRALVRMAIDNAAVRGS